MDLFASAVVTVASPRSSGSNLHDLRRIVGAAVAVDQKARMARQHHR